MKKKLTELLKNATTQTEVLDNHGNTKGTRPLPLVTKYCAEILADYLIANGVTFAPDTNVGKWIPAFEPPEKDGRYFVAVMPNFFSKPPEYYRSIASFTHNLEEVDDYDFRGKNRAGWYDYDSEYGYYELERVAYWMSLPKLPGEE